MAIEDAGGLPDVDRTRAGVHLGTGIGGVGTLETQVGVLADRGPRRVSPFTIPMVMPNAGRRRCRCGTG
jgi:3-oxoacyl-[acyl-carrier-protein] synthase II